MKRSKIYREAARVAYASDASHGASFLYRHYTAWRCFNDEWFGWDTLFHKQTRDDMALALCFAAAIAEAEETQAKVTRAKTKRSAKRASE